MMLIPSGKMVQFNQLGFRKTLLFYLKTNANPRLSLKLMQISRYFCFKEFPYMVVKDLLYKKGEWKYYELGSDQEDSKTLDLDNLTKPLWILDSLNFPSQIFYLLSKTAVCDIKLLSTVHENIKMDEFKFLISSNAVYNLTVFGTEFSYDDGSIVSVEEIVKLLPNLERINWSFCNSASEITPASTTKLIEYLNPSFLNELNFWDIPEIFDFTLFAKFMDNNPSIRFNLCFEFISDEYAKTINDYVKKLIESGGYKNRKICIEFPQQNEEYYNILHEHVWGS